MRCCCGFFLMRKINSHPEFFFCGHFHCSTGTSKLAYVLTLSMFLISRNRRKRHISIVSCLLSQSQQFLLKVERTEPDRLWRSVRFVFHSSQLFHKFRCHEIVVAVVYIFVVLRNQVCISS